MMAGGAAWPVTLVTRLLSPATVRSHVAAILRRLRVPDRAAAVRSLDPDA